MEDRATYETIKQWYLDCYFVYCRGKISRNQKWEENECERAYAYNEFVDVNRDIITAFETRFEQLMMQVVALILEGNRSEIMVEHHYKMINRLIEKEDFSKKINELSEEERFDFVLDLEMLNIKIKGVNPVK